MRDTLIAAGSNLPDGDMSPPQIVRYAQDSLSQLGWRTVSASRLYSNPAWPPGSDAPDYVNSVFAVAGQGGPEELLRDLHEVEARAGRRRGARYMSRTLDLDLLAWGDLVLPDVDVVRDLIEASGPRRHEVPGRLIIPHPRLQERAFVLVPLADVAPDWRHPIIGLTAQQMCAALPQAEKDMLKPL